MFKQRIRVRILAVCHALDWSSLYQSHVLDRLWVWSCSSLSLVSDSDHAGWTPAWINLHGSDSGCSGWRSRAKGCWLSHVSQG